MKSKDLIKILEKEGWRKKRFNGSHLIMKNDKDDIIVIPVHNKDLKPGLLNAILKDAGLK